MKKSDGHRAAMVFVVFCALASVVPAAGQDHCNALITHGIRNEWVTVSESEWNNLIFHQHCRKTDNSWSFSHDGQVGLRQPIPIGIVGDWFASETDRVEFCRRQADRSEGRQMEAARLSLLSSEALRAWNQCQLLAGRNVEISVNDLEGKLLGFSIRRTGSVPVKLTAVTFEGVDSCEVGGQDVESGDALDLPVDLGDTTLRCRRSEAQTEKGYEVSFQRSEIGIDTSEGSLDINLPPISRPYPQTVAELQQDLELRLRQLDKNISATKVISLGSGSGRPELVDKNLGAHRFCALSSAVDAHGDQGCGCRITFDDGNGQWKLFVQKEIKNQGCSCAAVCLD